MVIYTNNADDKIVNSKFPCIFRRQPCVAVRMRRWRGQLLVRRRRIDVRHWLVLTVAAWTVFTLFIKCFWLSPSLELSQSDVPSSRFDVTSPPFRVTSPPHINSLMIYVHNCYMYSTRHLLCIKTPLKHMGFWCTINDAYCICSFLWSFGGWHTTWW